jgi:hypothetical protein
MVMTHFYECKTLLLLGCVWGIGERKWGGNFRRRMMEGTRRGRDSARKILERGARVDRATPGYIMREECKRNRLRVKTGKRAARQGK